MQVKLYWFPLSHPAQAVRKMLALKGIEHELVHVLPGTQRAHLRLLGFGGGTVPAMKIDGRRIQGSLPIGRELEALVPEPSLYPSDPDRRAAADEAERWGDEVLQPVARRVLRYGLVRHVRLRRWMAEEHSPFPAPGLSARVSLPVSAYYARVVGATEQAVRRDLEQLPELLDRADALLEEGVLQLDPPNAAALQVLCTVRSLLGFSDLEPHIAGRPSAAAAARLFPDFPQALVPAYLPSEWLTTLRRPPAPVK